MRALIVRTAAVMAATAVYFGLAVVGGGGFAAFFAHPPLVALAVATFAIAVASLFVGGNLSAGIREDRSNRWVIAVFALIGIIDAYLPAYADRHALWIIDGDAVRWLGSYCSWPAARYGSGLSPCWAIGSADWWRSNPDTAW